MKHRISFILLLIAVFFSASAQEIEIIANNFQIDNFGNIYIHSQDKITKYNDKLQEIAVFSNKILGEITSFDVSNPFKILVFYQNHNKIIITDNKFAEISQNINLNELDILLPVAVCSSKNGGLWIVDSQQKQLIYLNNNHKDKNITNISNLLENDTIMPNFITEYDNTWLNIPNNKVICFDKMGSYIKTLYLQVPNNFKIVENKIQFFKENKIFNYDINTLNQTEAALPNIIDIIDAEIRNDKIYILTKDKFRIM